MYILGIACYYHDSAAALVKDGDLIAAAEEERFSRKKHDSGFPALAIQYCLKEAGISIDEVDYIGFYEKPMIKFDRILMSALATWPLSYKSFCKAIPRWLSSRLHIRKEIQTQLGTTKPILFGEHHLSHASAAFHVSPFDEAIILTLDGVGEWATTMYGYGKGIDIKIEKEIRFPHSLGLLYSAITSYLGFEVNDAEWKVMGLAPYGKPNYIEQFRKVIDVKDDGSFRLDMNYFTHDWSTSRMFNKRFEKLFGRPMREKEAELEDFHRDIAHSGQKIVEETIVKIAQSLYDKYQCPNLCIAGGVGLNSVANWKILKETPIKNIFIQPAAGDDGSAIGMAFFIYHSLLKQPRHFVMNHAYFGPSFTNEECEAFLQSKNISYKKLNEEELLKQAAQCIWNNEVIGWFQGRMEFGPRALGSRSILANPCNAEMKEIINLKIKFREKFRPFAPSILREEVQNWYHLEGDSPFMLLVPKVREEKKDIIPAPTHIDGTGRVQTVTKEDNPLYYKLISRFKELSGVPIVVNTSFNVRGEPIVCTPADAYNCFKNTGIDSLFLQNCWITKNQGEAKNS
ncbi:MAG: carbamoyltransferase [Planctomycetota bacterium]